VSLPSNPELSDAVHGLAKPFGLTIDETAVSGIAGFCQLLLRWNARINLTGARTWQELVRDHLPDSFALATLVPQAARVLDVGTGGGLPAVPFAILRPDVQLTLLEPRAKRVAFLRAATRELCVAARVVTGRAEEINETFDVVGSRATFAPREWFLVGPRLVDPGGVLVFFLSDAGELPFPEGEAQKQVRYRAGDKERLAVAWRRSGG
jgi:16S rRNA (guanine527-N7)-methyltransferase